MINLTNLKTYIIDSNNPEEVDDAISLEITKDNKKLLWIHISNPCKLFNLDSDIDQEARRNFSSLYLINDYIPMLPNEIIEIANLKQNKLSHTISACIEFNENGSIKKYIIVEAIIKPKYQLSYEDAEEILEIEPKEELELIEIKRLLLNSINYRKSKGAVIFEVPINKIKVHNNNVFIEHIYKTTSQEIVSESMILMGHVTSLYLSENNISVPYRTQKIICDAKDILEKYKDSKIKYSILKQFMGKSYITVKPNNHESLALSKYVQCTSPLRRYSDLIVQRQVYNHINKKKVINNDNILKLIDYFKKRQIDINEIYKNDRIKYLTLFFNQENNKNHKVIFIKWINRKKNIALVFFTEYSLELLIVLFISIETYSNKIYTIKYSVNNNNLLEFIH